MADDKSGTTISSEKAEEHKTEPGIWGYRNLVALMRRNHPNLASLAEILSQPSEKGAAAVVEFHETHGTEKRFFHSSELLHYLNRANDCDRRLFLLQGLPSNYIGILGPQFNIDPNFFARQIQSGILHSSKGVRDIPLLSSHPTSRESFCIRYHELREFADPIRDWELRVMDQARRVSVSKWNGEFDGVGIVRKNASVWFRARKEKGWDGKSSLQRVHGSWSVWMPTKHEQQSFCWTLPSVTNSALELKGTISLALSETNCIEGATLTFPPLSGETLVSTWPRVQDRKETALWMI